MAAAPADFRAAEVSPRQARARAAPSSCASSRPRTSSPASPPPAATSQTIVGFAAEHGEGGVERARAKLERKGADLIVLNDVSDSAIGFESEENAVTLIDAAGETPVPQASKDSIADSILDRVDALRARTSGLY